MKGLLILNLLLCSYLVSGSDFSKEELDNIKGKFAEATNYVGAAHKALLQNDPSTFVQQVGKLIGMIPGPVGSIGNGVLGFVSGFLPKGEQQNEFTFVLDKLLEINAKINGITETLGEVKNELILELRLTELSKYETALQDIESNYQAMLKQNNSVSRDRLINTCTNVKYNNIARWFRDEVMGEHTTTPIVSEIRKKNDRKLYFNFIKTFVGNFLQATVLQTACTAAIYANKSKEQLQEEIDTDTDDYQKMLSEINNKAKLEDEAIVRDFWGNAEQDISNLAVGKDTMDNTALANFFLTFLQKKYYWRSWFVAVYGDQNTAGFDNHRHDNYKPAQYADYESYFHLFVRLHNKNIALASPENRDVGSFREKAQDCLDNALKGIWLVQNCNEAITGLSKCMSNNLYMSVGCAKDMKSYAYATNSDGVVYKKFTSSHTGGYTAPITITHKYDLYFTH